MGLGGGAKGIKCSKQPHIQIIRWSKWKYLKGTSFVYRHIAIEFAPSQISHWKNELNLLPNFMSKMTYTILSDLIIFWQLTKKNIIVCVDLDWNVCSLWFIEWRDSDKTKTNYSSIVTRSRTTKAQIFCLMCVYGYV